MSIPLITIDGPSGSGKGTIALRLAHELGWHFLDSGALYRITALATLRKGLDLNDEARIAGLVPALKLRFSAAKDGTPLIHLDNEDITDKIRDESVGVTASKISAFLGVRAALVDAQRAFLAMPGLVADGRDMGTVIFPEAPLKIYLEASIEARAGRRLKQLSEMGLDVKLGPLMSDLAERDKRDMTRKVCPLRPAEDAVVIDSTSLSVDEVYDLVRKQVETVFPETVSVWKGA